MKANFSALCHGPSSSHRLHIEGAATGISKIMGYLDGKSRGSCRSVCRAWKEVIDEVIGARVKLNERKYEKGNGAFCRSVLIERLTVEHLDKFSKFITLKYPEKLRMLNCIGPIDSNWFKGKLLAKCRHLVRIDLSGPFLHSHQLVSDSDGPTETNSEDRQLFQNTKANTPHITFPHLQSLIISYNHGDVQAYQSEINGSGTLQAIWGTIFGRPFQTIYLLKQRIDVNVAYILSTIRSLSLRILYVAVDGMHLDEDKDHPIWIYTWKQEPLKAFLEAHRQSLRSLYLPHYNGDSRGDDRTHPIFPCDLSTLEVSLLQKGDRKNTLFMERLLLVQMELRELRLEKHYIGNSLTEFPNLVGVIAANERTLTFVHLTLSHPDQGFMDGHVFTHCKSLRTLVIERSHDGVIFKCVSKLPKSLRELRIHPMLLLLPSEVIKAKRFPELETLILDDVLFESTGHCKRQEMIRFIRHILSMRRLNRVHLDTKEPDCSGAQPCLVLNSLLRTLRGGGVDGGGVATRQFSSLEIHSPRRDVLEAGSVHFLKSDPLYRSEVDPTKKSRIPSHFENLFSLSIDQVILTSNIFKEDDKKKILVPGSRPTNDEGPREEEPWCDFCYAIFSAAD